MTFDRRSVLMMGAGVGASLLLPQLGRTAPSFAGQKLVYATWGGQYEEAQREAYVKPFVAKTGVDILVDGPVDETRLRVMLEAGNNDWDVVCTNEQMMVGFGAEGYLAKPDPSIVDMSRIAKDFQYDYGVGVESGAFTIAYSESAFEGKESPKTWADLYDLDRFPGKRMMNSSPSATLEGALLADGVKMSELYPLDIDRAFKKLDTIKDQTIFYSTHAQSQQLIIDGAVTCGYMFSARAFGAMKNGAKVAISWEGHLRTNTPVIVPKNVKNPELAWTFVNSMLEPVNQAKMITGFISSPANPAAFNYVDPSYLAWLPTSKENYPKGIGIDAAYWGSRLKEVTERWQEWLLL
ncbi:ABC transporter substrate-binding protein [Rhizobium sp. CF142]|uniref:ABC transporter substrate-binding protein n=1 Tax=Rhizobium sp. CF142 TaxID=1144314 RepID=UPI00026EEAEC|nr:ABC transporter substrate-binding protein [Rhizobium sp. CF142]EJJ31492.1 spermidine/putrescine-binding periplasmic protein [Rhizobium sp. CF142]